MMPDPTHPTPADDIRAALDSLRAQDLPTHGGRTLSYVYDSGLAEAEVAREGDLLVVDYLDLGPANSGTVSVGSVTVPFQIDDYTRWRLMEGLDDVGLTLRHEADIDAFEARRASWLPKTLPARNAESV